MNSGNASSYRDIRDSLSKSYPQAPEENEKKLKGFDIGLTIQQMYLDSDYHITKFLTTCQVFFIQIGRKKFNNFSYLPTKTGWQAGMRHHFGFGI